MGTDFSGSLSFGALRAALETAWAELLTNGSEITASDIANAQHHNTARKE